MLTVNIIGAGPVGQTLGYLLVHHQLAQIVGVMNTSPQSAINAIQFMGQGQYYATVHELPHAALTLITTPDAHIQKVAEALVHNPQLQPGDVVIHCAGALTSDCLAILSSKKVAVASLHPMMSFKHPSISITSYVDIPCAVEGDAAAIAVITPLFTALGSWVYAIDKDKKALYHAAAVFASNYQVTLAQQAVDCLRAAGLQDAEAQQVVVRLMQSMVRNVAHTAEPKLALTGPVQRGDVIAIARHLQALADNPALHALYITLGRTTLAMTGLDDDKRSAILSLFDRALTDGALN